MIFPWPLFNPGDNNIVTKEGGGHVRADASIVGWVVVVGLQLKLIAVAIKLKLI